MELQNETPLSQREMRRRRLAGSPRRPRPNTKLGFLTDEQHQKLCEWLRSPIPYFQIAERIEKQFGIKVSKGNVSDFYARHLALQANERRGTLIGASEQISKDIAAKPASYAKPIVDALEGRLFRAANDDRVPIRTVHLLTTMWIRIRQQSCYEAKISIKMREVKMLERREARAAAVLQDKKLSAEQLAERMREIFQK